MQSMIKLNGDGWSIIATKEAEQLKKSLIKQAKGVLSVRSKDEEKTALSSLSELASFRKQLEATRKDVKQPVLDLGKRIDRTAEEFGEDVGREEKRIRTLLGAYQEELEAVRRRLAQEAADKEAEARRLAEEAEAARLKAEQKPSVMAEVRAEKLENKFMDTLVAAKQLEQQAEDTKVKGSRMEIEFDVEDINAFYAMHPNLCTVTAKTREVKEYLKRLAEKTGDNIPKVPGLRVYRKAVITVR